MNDDGTVTLAGGRVVDFGEFMMAFAPMDVVCKLCEPL